MTSSNAYDLPGVESSDELKGLGILLVEDSWHVGSAMKNLLQVMGAKVVGPAATAAEAERLLSEHAPDVAIVDFNLRGGEQAKGLIDRLHDQGVHVIVTSGYAVLPLPPPNSAVMLQKPVSEAELLGALRPFVAEKTGR
jgi:DNA-binding NarL/FixJ family response regulator